MRIFQLRKMTWAILAWTAILSVWMISAWAIDSTITRNPCGVGSGEADCLNASQPGTGLGDTYFISFLWFLGFVAFSLIWFVTRPKRRPCPDCGENIRTGSTGCENCGFDFAPLSAGPLSPPPPPPPVLPAPPPGYVAIAEPTAQAALATDSVTTDFDLQTEGAVSFLTPLTPAANEWVSEYISDDVQRHAGAVVIEQCYVEELLSGITGHGLGVARSLSHRERSSNVQR